MTLDQLAAKTRSSKSYLWELENRDAPPHRSAERIFAIAPALGVTPDFLLEQEEPEADEAVLDGPQTHAARYYCKRRLWQILDAWDEELGPYSQRRSLERGFDHHPL